MDLLPTKDNLRAVAGQLGFAECRVARAGRAEHAEAFFQYLEEGREGEMAWLARNPQRRVDPREVLPGCQSVISLALNYFPGQESPNQDYRIARYAWNDDYHDILEDKMADLCVALEMMGGQQRYYVDTGPVLERDFATTSGLGWNGKSTVQIHRRFGPWLFLAEILTTLPFAPDEEASNHCGKCVRCLTACPTSAITAPHQLDARRCLSYLTIEHPGAFPLEFRRALGNRLYGCDECLEVCPWNRFAQLTRETRLQAREALFEKPLVELLRLSEEAFRELFRHSPIRRIKRQRFRRNVCVVLGNVGGPAEVPALEEVEHEGDELLAEHATWAKAEILRRAGR